MQWGPPQQCKLDRYYTELYNFILVTATLVKFMTSDHARA